jgi:hypothetical protein
MPRPSLLANEKADLQAQVSSLQKALLLQHKLIEMLAERLERLEKVNNAEYPATDQINLSDSKTPAAAQ